MVLPPFALTKPTKDTKLNIGKEDRKVLGLVNVVTDNSPLFMISADSALNRRLEPGQRFNKRMKISLEDSPNQLYTGSNIDLTFMRNSKKISIENDTQ